MASENVAIVQRAYAYFIKHLEIRAELYRPDFVWDMTTFEGWPERQQYQGAAGATEFLSDWVGQWDDWEMEVGQLIDAGDRVVAICHQHGESKLTGARVEMDFAQVWTLRDGLFARMEMYSDVGEALAQTGLAAGGAGQLEPDVTRRSAS